MNLQKILILVICIIQIGCNSNQNACDCEAVLKNKNYDYDVFAKPDINSEILYVLENDSINENYFIVELHGTLNEWGFITAYSPNKKHKEKGWMKLNELVVSPVDFSQPIFLYEKPDSESDRTEILNYNFSPLEIIGCDSTWIKVKYSDSKAIYQGWLPKENQCANPYTTCN